MKAALEVALNANGLKLDGKKPTASPLLDEVGPDAENPLHKHG